MTLDELLSFVIEHQDQENESAMDTDSVSDNKINIPDIHDDDAEKTVEFQKTAASEDDQSVQSTASEQTIVKGDSVERSENCLPEKVEDDGAAIIDNKKEAIESALPETVINTGNDHADQEEHLFKLPEADLIQTIKDEMHLASEKRLSVISEESKDEIGENEVPPQQDHVAATDNGSDCLAEEAEIHQDEILDEPEKSEGRVLPDESLESIPDSVQQTDTLQSNKPTPENISVEKVDPKKAQAFSKLLKKWDRSISNEVKQTYVAAAPQKADPIKDQSKIIVTENDPVKKVEESVFDSTVPAVPEQPERETVVFESEQPEESDIETAEQPETGSEESDSADGNDAIESEIMIEPVMDESETESRQDIPEWSEIMTEEMGFSTVNALESENKPDSLEPEEKTIVDKESVRSESSEISDQMLLEEQQALSLVEAVFEEPEEAEIPVFDEVFEEVSEIPVEGQNNIFIEVEPQIPKRESDFVFEESLSLLYSEAEVMTRAENDKEGLTIFEESMSPDEETMHRMLDALFTES